MPETPALPYPASKIAALTKGEPPRALPRQRGSPYFYLLYSSQISVGSLSELPSGICVSAITSASSLLSE